MSAQRVLFPDLQVQPGTKHGGRPRGRKSPEYTVWCEMRRRCNNPTRHNYKYYGGRGIRVCKRWDSFERFLRDLGPRPPGGTLERSNVNGNYSPKNCYWETSWSVQMLNRRKHNLKAYYETREEFKRKREASSKANIRTESCAA
jgi:hypothetical protein